MKNVSISSTTNVIKNPHSLKQTMVNFKQCQKNSQQIAKRNGQGHGQVQAKFIKAPTTTMTSCWAKSTSHPCLNLPGWCWARIKQLALIGSSSSLHSEACKALGGSDGVVHSTISLAAICMRAVANNSGVCNNQCVSYPMCIDRCPMLCSTQRV